MNQVLIQLICVVFPTLSAWAGSVQVYPARPGEEMSKTFQVQVGGKRIPVYVAKVAPADLVRRWKAMDGKVYSADYFEKASFACFDIQGSVTVTVM